jgi:hypothetical protein
MKKLDYQFWRDLTSIISYILFSVSILGQHFSGHHLYSKHIIAIMVILCITIIFICLLKMMHAKHYESNPIKE